MTQETHSQMKPMTLVLIVAGAITLLFGVMVGVAILSQPGPVRIDLLNKEKKVLRTWNFKTSQSLNRFQWDFLIDKNQRKKLPAGRRPFVLPGVYTLKLTAPEGKHSLQIEVKKPGRSRS